MKERLLRIFVCISIFIISDLTAVKAQTIYFSEGFELGKKPNNWSEETIEGSIPWRFRNGGYNPADPNLISPPEKFDMLRNPNQAYKGTFNSWFFTQGIGKEQTRLITPPIDLSFGITPTLSFWLALHEWRVATGINNDILRVYYKVGSTGGWRLLQTYNFIQNSWRDFQIAIPAEACQKQVYFAFEGLSRWGMGVCLDEIKIEETGSLDRFLAAASIENASEDIIPNGTNNNPILCTRLRVSGNQGNAILNKLTVNATGTNLADITKVKLYATKEPFFNTSTLLAAESLNGSSVTFSPNTNLETGYTYIWVTYDISAAAKSKNTVDASIPVDGIQVNTVKAPSTVLNSPGTRVIKQNLFFDDFESDKGWAINGDFEIDVPQGKKGLYGNPDPSIAYSGTKVLGNDLTHDGVYDPNVRSNAPYTATSPKINASFYRGVVINYKRWLNADLFDTLKVQASNDNGVTWKTVWYNSTYALDDSWQSHSITLPSEFDRKEEIRVRFTLSYSNDTREFTGWNIDDFSVIGNFMEKDLAMGAIISPTSSCGSATAGQPITIKVKNAGSKEAVAPIPVKIFLNETTVLNDNIQQNIAPGTEATVTLTQTLPANLYGDINVKAQLLLPNDEDLSNDTLSTNVFIARTFDTPYNNGFDVADDWFAKGANWKHGTSAITNIQGDSPNDQMWITNLNGNYENNSRSTLTGPCFNIVGLEKPMLEFKTSYITEKGKDGFTVEYSADNGQTWQPIGNNTDAWDNLWNWNKQETIASAAKVGFTGNSNGWLTVNHLLPASLYGLKGVKFRFNFTSDAQNNIFEGAAINSFTIKESPDDFGVSALVAPVEITTGDICASYTNAEKITFKIKNYGIKTAKAGTKIKVAFQSNYSKPLSTVVNKVEKFEEEFTLPTDLAINAEQTFTTVKTINMDRGGKYEIIIKSFDDPDNFYQTNNDSFTKTIRVNKPVVDLGPTVYLLAGVKEQHQFNISEYSIGYTVDWETKVNGTWSPSAGGGDTRIAKITDFITPNNKITYRVTLTDVVSGCKVSSNTDVYKRNPDITMLKIVTPIDSCSHKQKQQFKVIIKNTGRDIDTIRTNEILTLQLNFKGIPGPAHQLKLDKDLAPGATLEYIYPDVFDMSATGTTYSVKPSVTMMYDVNAANDILDATIKSFGYPNFVLTPKTQVVEALDYTYDAGAGYKGYKWYDASTLQTNKVSAPGPNGGKIWCAVTDNNGCTTKSEATITFSIKDIAIKSLNNIQTKCTQEAGLKPSITIENKGNVAIPNGTTIPFEVEVNGVKHADSFVLTSDFAAGTTLDATLSKPIDIQTKGDYAVKVISQLAGDLIADNNALSANIKTFGLPVSTLPATVNTKDVDAKLDAGAGFVDYLWSTTEISQAITVSKNGVYTVRITDGNGCSDNFSSTVTFIRNDLAIDLTSSYGTNNNVCTGTTEYPVSVRIRNTGNDILKVGAIIPVSYKVGDVTVDENITLTEELKPTGNTTYTFTKKVVFDAAGTKALSAMIKMDDETFANNFTEVVNVQVAQTPTVSLGDDITSTNANVTIFPTITPELADYTYLWSNAVTTRNNTVSQSGEYTLTVNNKGCSASDKIIVTLNKFDIAAEAAAIETPGNGCFSAESRKVSLNIKNSGYEPIPAKEKITLTYKVAATSGTEIATATEELILDAPLAVGESKAYTFTKVVTALAANSYKLTVGATFAADGISANNSASKELTVNPLPEIAFPTSISAAGTEYTLTGPADMAKWEWNTGATTQSIKVTTSGTYTLTATNAFGCAATKTTTVSFSADISLTAIKNGNACQNTEAAPLMVTITNTGTKTIPNGTALTFSGSVNGTAFNQTKILTADLIPNATVDITLTTTLPTSTAGICKVNVVVALEGEAVTANNSAEKSITINSAPTVTLPAEIVAPENTQKLTGPDGYTSYEWKNGATVVGKEQSITVNAAGTYTLTVTNSSGCSASAATRVIFKLGDIALKSIKNSEKACQSTSGNPLILEIGNDGLSAIVKGETISINGTADGVPFNATYTLTDDLQPKATTIITTTALIPATTEGKTVAVVANVSYQFDNNHSNESATKNMLVVANPTFSIDMKTVADKSEATLTASKTDLTYLWSTGSTSRITTVYENAIFKVTGTNANGCSLTKNVQIDFIIPKSKNFLMVYPAVSETKCLQDASAPFEVFVTNESLNTTVAKGTNVSIECSYKITKADGKQEEYKFSGSLTLPTDLKSTGKERYKFNNMTSLGKQTENIIKEAAGKQIVTGFTTVNGIKGLEKSTQFEIYPLPVVEFGKDVIYRSLPGVLKIDLPTNGYTFLWSTGEQTNNIIVKEEGEYSVTVTSKQGCVASDKVEVKEGSEKASIDVNVYPNPASNLVNIEAFAKETEDIIVEVYTSSGILMHNQEFKQSRQAVLVNFDVSGYTSGSYIVMVRTKSTKVAKMLIVGK